MTEKISIKVIDKLSGFKFEQFIKDFLLDIGFQKIEVTKKSGDFGVDVIAYFDNKKWAVQTKRWNKAMSESKEKDSRSREEIVYEAHERVYNSLRENPASFLYKDRTKNLDSNILASIKQRESEIDKAHSKMIANPNPKRGWVPFQSRLKDLRSRY